MVWILDFEIILLKLSNRTLNWVAWPFIHAFEKSREIFGSKDSWDVGLSSISSFIIKRQRNVNVILKKLECGVKFKYRSFLVQSKILRTYLLLVFWRKYLRDIHSPSTIPDWPFYNLRIFQWVIPAESLTEEKFLYGHESSRLGYFKKQSLWIFQITVNHRCRTDRLNSEFITKRLTWCLKVQPVGS